MIAHLIDRMIAAGMSPGEAGSIAAELFAAGVASASVRSTGAERTRRYRAKLASQSDAYRHETSQCDDDPEASQNVTKRHQPSQCDASDKTPLTKNSITKNSKRQNRGTRIAPDWSPSDAERAFASQQGFSDFEVQRQADNFRDWWTSCAGSKAVKLDWTATWQNWVRSSAERTGKIPTNPASAAQPIDWDAVLTTYKKIGHWSKWAGPDLTSPACRAPRELLEKYGLLSDGRTVN